MDRMRQLVAEYFLGMQDGGLLCKELAQAREWTVQQYLTQARDWYKQWGAKGLVRHLETKYSQYLMSKTTFDSVDLGNLSEFIVPSLPKMVINATTRSGD
jgi:hypothetical protein